MTVAEEKLSLARAIVRAKAPYFMSAIYGLIPYEDMDTPTMRTTDGMVLLYNPDFVNSIDEKVCAGILVHEVMHVLRDHLSRFATELAGEEALLANIAMDIAINPDLLHAGWQLTPGALVPEMFELPSNKTAEEYFELLKKQQSKKSKNKKGTGSQGQSQGQGQNNDQQQGSGKNSGHGSPGVCKGDCSGKSSNPNQAAKEKEIDEQVGRSDLDKIRIQKTTTEDIKKHIEQQGRGNIPGSLVELIGKLNQLSKIPWRQELQSVLRKVTGQIKSGGKDFSLRRPSKRSYCREIMRPGLVQQLPEIAIIRDTSGSMGAQQIMEAVVESCAIAKAAGVDSIWFMDADTQVAFCKRVRIHEIDKLPVHGRGGTDFHPAIEAATKLKPKPDIIIYVTDGDGYAPKEPPPGIAFIWCVVPSYYGRAPAKWGKTIFVTDKNIEVKEPRDGP